MIFAPHFTCGKLHCASCELLPSVCALKSKKLAVEVWGASLGSHPPTPQFPPQKILCLPADVAQSRAGAVVVVVAQLPKVSFVQAH